MRTPIARRFVVTVLALLVLAPMSVFAEPPDVQIVEIDRTGIVGGLSQRCGFLIQKQDEGTIRITTYYDKDGQVSQVQIHKMGPYRITLANVLSGTSVTSNSAESNHLHYDNGQLVSQAMTGVYESITVPGAGLVFVEVGRLVVDTEARFSPRNRVLFEAGEHNIQDFNFTGTFDPAALCAALE